MIHSVCVCGGGGYVYECMYSLRCFIPEVSKYMARVPNWETLASDFVYTLSIGWSTWLLECFLDSLYHSDYPPTWGKNESVKIKHDAQVYWISRLKKCFLSRPDIKSKTPVLGPRTSRVDFIKQLSQQSPQTLLGKKRKGNTDQFVSWGQYNLDTKM